MQSVIQSEKRCFLCGRRINLDEHHVFFGKNRKLSEKYGLKVYLCHEDCHIFGKNAVHNNAEICRKLQREVQAQAMEHYNWTAEDFIRIFGKSYL